MAGGAIETVFSELKSRTTRASVPISSLWGTLQPSSQGLKSVKCSPELWDSCWWGCPGRHRWSLFQEGNLMSGCLPMSAQHFCLQDHMRLGCHNGTCRQQMLVDIIIRYKTSSGLGYQESIAESWAWTTCLGLWVSSPSNLFWPQCHLWSST